MKEQGADLNFKLVNVSEFAKNPLIFEQFVELVKFEFSVCVTVRFAIDRQETQR